MNPSPLKLDLASAQCLSLELQFPVVLPEPVRRELSALGSRESDEEDVVYFHEDYLQENQKLHSWAEVRVVGAGESEVDIEYLAESELEDQTELHHTDFTLSHLFNALEGVTSDVAASFNLRFDLGSGGGRFLRLMSYQAGINGGLSVEYRGAHVQVKTPQGDLYDLWFDMRPDDTVELTLRFSLNQRPTAELPGQGLRYGRDALAKLLGS